MQPGSNIFILSDIHYGCAAEQARGVTEYQAIANPFLRFLVRMYRHWIWRRNPFAHNHLLDTFVDQAGRADWVIADGDYSCDTAFVGISDSASLQSAKECLEKLRGRFGPRFRATLGDHELGKMSLFGGRGGIRLASWERAQTELGLDPFWSLPIGDHLLLGITSSVVALPVFENEMVPGERARWQEVRRAHLALVRSAFAELESRQRVLLFCHDPTALPFLWEDPAIRPRLGQVEATVIGHLHSELYLWESRLLSGMPTISFLGNSIRRMSTALSQGRLWKHFGVKLCPALAGIELLRDGGYLRMELPAEAGQPIKWQRCRLNSNLAAPSRKLELAQTPNDFPHPHD
jgi:hypothetical protein